MLVLSRKCDESIVINPGTPDEVVVTVVAVRGDKVRLGVDADPSIVVHRQEVWESIRGEAAPEVRESKRAMRRNDDGRVA